MSARRILFVEASTGGVVGGSLTGILHLIPRLDRARFAPVLSLFEEKKGIETDGFPVHVLPPLPRRGAAASPGLIPRALRHAGNLYATFGSRARALARLYRRERPDLVYLSNGFGAQLDGVAAAKLCRLPVVCHEKGFEHFGPLGFLSAVAERQQIIRGANQHAGAAVCPRPQPLDRRTGLTPG